LAFPILLAHPKGIGSVLAAGGVRLSWQNLPLETEEGQPFDLCAWLEEVPESGAQKQAVW